MDQLKGWEIVDVLYYSNVFKIKLRQKFSPEGILSVNLIKYNGIYQMILTWNDIVIWRSGNLP